MNLIHGPGFNCGKQLVSGHAGVKGYEEVTFCWLEIIVE